MISNLLSQYGYYGFLGLGAVSMAVLAVWRRKQYGISAVSAVSISLLLLVCGIAGAKLLFFAESGFSSFSGMSFFGAVFLVLLVMPIVGCFFRLKASATLDLCAPCVSSIISFMRFGCFCAGCCGGIICTVGELRFRWPTQLMEGFGDLLILVFLLRMEKREQKKGTLYPLFLIVYGFMRFFIEFFRDTPKNLLGLSEGQWLALLGVTVGAGAITVLRKHKVKT